MKNFKIDSIPGTLLTGSSDLIWIVKHKKSGFKMVFHSEEMAMDWINNTIKYQTKF
jgi:hypothetical protein